MKISDHFTLQELTFSARAEREGWDNLPTAAQIKNLERLTHEVLEPLRAHVGEPIFILSGYRCRLVNEAEGGQFDSAHLDGRAADIRCHRLSPLELGRIAVSLHLPFSQLINEFGQWLHVSIPRENNPPAGQILHTVRLEHSIKYSRGLI